MSRSTAHFPARLAFAVLILLQLLTLVIFNGRIV